MAAWQPCFFWVTAGWGYDRDERWSSSLHIAVWIRVCWIPDAGRTSTWEQWTQISSLPLTAFILETKMDFKGMEEWEDHLVDNTCLYPSSYRKSVLIRLRIFPQCWPIAVTCDEYYPRQTWDFSPLILNGHKTEDKEQDRQPTVGALRKLGAGQDIQTTTSSLRQTAGIFSPWHLTVL